MGLPFFVDYRRRVLVQSASNADRFDLPPFGQNDGTPIEVAILDSQGGVRPTYTKRVASTYSLKVGLFLASNGSQLAFQNTFTLDAANDKWTGNLTANSSNQTTALTSADTVDCELEIEISSDGGANYETVLPKVNGRCTLVKERIVTAAASVPPNETAVTVSNLPALVAALIKSGFILENTTAGIERLIHLDEFGQIQGAPIVPTPE